MVTKISGCYQNIEDKFETIKIDIDGSSPQHVVSGKITHKLFDNTYWLASLDKISDTTYEGDIYYTAGFLDNFRYTKVRLYVGGNEEAELHFFISEKPYCRHYRKSTDYFRAVSLSFCYQKDIKPVHSIRPKDHSDHSVKLPDHTIDYQQVFGQAGIQINLDDNGGELEIDKSASFSWSDRELHGAMRSYWRNYSENPDWAMWVFMASTHKSGDHIQGKMFDNIGDHHRQGVAIFYQSIENEVPGSQKYSPEKEIWIERQKFWATCHEIGHGFNLYHSWQREDAKSWMPLKNESHIASFMNYPDRYPGRSKCYFRDFLYEFSDSELLFLRHSPDHFVRMGDARWFDVEGFNHFTPHPRLKLKTFLSKENFDFMETVFIRLSLSNTGKESISLPKNILADCCYLTVIIKKKEGKSLMYEKLSHECARPETITLGPAGGQAHTITCSMQISIGKAGWYISKPGQYAIYAAVSYKDQVALSEPVRLTVEPPKGKYAEKLAQDHFTSDTASTLYFTGNKTDHKTNDHLLELIDKIPDQNAAIHAGLALAMPEAEPYRVLDPIERKIDILTPSTEKAYLGVKKVLNHPGAESSLGSMNFHNYAKIVTDMEDRLNW